MTTLFVCHEGSYFDEGKAADWSLGHSNYDNGFDVALRSMVRMELREDGLREEGV